PSGLELPGRHRQPLGVRPPSPPQLPESDSSVELRGGVPNWLLALSFDGSWFQGDGVADDLAGGVLGEAGTHQNVVLAQPRDELALVICQGDCGPDTLAQDRLVCRRSVLACRAFELG